MSKNPTFKRGIHPADEKNWSADQPVEVMPVPAELTIPLLQHIGPPCLYKLKPKTALEAFSVLAEAEKMPGADIHVPAAGETSLLTSVTLANGRHVPAVKYKTKTDDKSGHLLWNMIKENNWLYKLKNNTCSAEDVQKLVCSAGVVGQGGAAFPTHIKLRPPKDAEIKDLLVNGCECEPYLTADYQMMIEASEAIVAGALLAGKAVGAEKITIVIEDNKPLAIEKMTEAVKDTEVAVCVVETKYPMGGEKQLISAVTGRTVITGKLPMDSNVAVVNVGTAVSVALAVIEKKPLTWRIVSVAGKAVNRSCNVFVPVGVSYKDIIDFCGGFSNDPAKVLSGGPMMGFSLGNLDTPVTKGTSGITVLARAEEDKKKETSCIRCGRCVDSCPLGLVPTKIALASRKNNLELANEYQLMACCECGCCTWICPAGIPLTQLIRTGKSAEAKRRRALCQAK